MAVLLGGRAAEELVFGEISTGAADDLPEGRPTSPASMVTRYGMVESLGHVTYEAEQPDLPRRPRGRRLARAHLQRGDGARDRPGGAARSSTRAFDRTLALLEQQAPDPRARRQAAAGEGDADRGRSQGAAGRGPAGGGAVAGDRDVMRTLRARHPDRGRCAERLLPRRRPRREPGRRGGDGGERPRATLSPRGADPGLAQARPSLLRQQPCRPGALRDHRAPLRQADPVAGSLRRRQRGRRVSPATSTSPMRRW